MKTIIDAMISSSIDTANFSAFPELLDPAKHDAQIVLFNPKTGELREFRIFHADGADVPFLWKVTNGKMHPFAVCGSDGRIHPFKRLPEGGKLRKYAKLINAIPAARAAGIEVKVKFFCPVTGRPLTSYDSVMRGIGPKGAAELAERQSI